MHIAQRMLLATTIMIVFLFGFFFIYGNKAEKLCGQWENLQTEQFMGQVNRLRKLTEDNYISYVASLNYSGVRSDVRIEIYQKEEDISGEIYYRLVSSEEIEEDLAGNGEVYFRPKGIIKITICRSFWKRNRKNIYAAAILGKEV